MRIAIGSDERTDLTDAVIVGIARRGMEPHPPLVLSLSKPVLSLVEEDARSPRRHSGGSRNPEPPPPTPSARRPGGADESKAANIEWLKRMDRPNGDLVRPTPSALETGGGR